MKKIMIVCLLLSFSSHAAVAAIGALLLAGCFFWLLADERLKARD